VIRNSRHEIIDQKITQNDTQSEGLREKFYHRRSKEAGKKEEDMAVENTGGFILIDPKILQNKLANVRIV
jgi:hypothetical protein